MFSIIGIGLLLNGLGHGVEFFRRLGESERGVQCTGLANGLQRFAVLPLAGEYLGQLVVGAGAGGLFGDHFAQHALGLWQLAFGHGLLDVVRGGQGQTNGGPQGGQKNGDVTVQWFQGHGLSLQVRHGGVVSQWQDNAPHLKAEPSLGKGLAGEKCVRLLLRRVQCAPPASTVAARWGWGRCVSQTEPISKRKMPAEARKMSSAARV